MPKFKPVDSKVDFPKMEEQVLRFWKENKVFEKSVDQRPKSKSWTFLDGPPFVTGMPHYGTLLSSIPKDLFGRYWTMKGYHVRRVWGWDGHGLPIENKVETKLKIKRKRDIEDVVGIDKFIKECLGYVQEVSAEWEWYVDHIGRWVDFKNAYRTWDLPYMETVMWVFKQIYDKGHIYKGLRVSLYCPHCATPISNFEVAMDPDNYQEVTEPADTYKYQLEDDPETYLLAWSTTPWNKIATPALAVNPKLTYVKVRQGGAFYILAKNTLKMLLDQPYKVTEEFKGETLIGKKFVPHYNFYTVDPGKKAFVVIGGDFVTADEGTGIVTIAAYGEEDLVAMKANNIQVVLHIDEEGVLRPEVPKWAGMYYLDVNEKVNEDLKERGLLYREDPYTHTVPTCWRCHARLIYAPQDAWYIDIQKLKDQMTAANEKVNWFPAHFKHGRFLKNLLVAPDWCISRSRYWGSPVPVWECECGERFVPESIAQLEKASGTKIENLHKPGIDQLEIKCPKCDRLMKRTPEVLDSWVEAGSASFAERHYPFSKKEKLGDFFPPDFIVEYTGQIRAWFYVLHVICSALLSSPAFKNAAVTGVILGTDGRKMSKNFGNYPDPKEMLQKYGGDALRLYLLGSPVMNAEDIRISEEEYRNQVRTFLLTLWNVYSFFVTYANLNFLASVKKPVVSKNTLDQWVLALLDRLISQVTASLEKYDTVTAVVALKSFVDDLSLWYIRRSRDRQTPEFFATCYEVLVTLCKLLAPFAPFIAEEIYKNLTGKESVHLDDWPSNAPASAGQASLIQNMALARKICELGHAKRKEAGIRVRQPLAAATVTGEELDDDLTALVTSELNIKKLEFKKGKELTVSLNTKLTPELLAEGQAREIVRQIQEARKEAKTALDQKVVVHLPDWPKEFEEYIKKETLATKLVHDSNLHITS